jgi:hypothetical protein
MYWMVAQTVLVHSAADPCFPEFNRLAQTRVFLNSFLFKMSIEEELSVLVYGSVGEPFESQRSNGLFPKSKTQSTISISSPTSVADR